MSSDQMFVTAVLAPWVALPFVTAVCCEVKYRRSREDKDNIALFMFGVTAVLAWLPAGFALAVAASFGMLS